MKLAHPENSPFTNIVFVLSLAASLGGVLFSSISAMLSMPIIALASLAVGVAGFGVLMTLLLVALGSELARIARARTAQPKP